MAEKQRHDFFSNASHEFRTPLTVLKGYTEMMRDDVIPPQKQKNILDIMQAQIDKMESLTHQILLLSQIENQPIEKQLEPVPLPEILHNVQHTVCMAYPNYQFLFFIDDNLLIRGHKEQLHSVVTNLIYNAIKHTRESTEITVVWKQTEQGAYFCVRDTGEGISENHLHRLTERFYKVDNARIYEKNSSGLGLAIVKHALFNHGNAQLHITSSVGKGSSFSFTLPKRYILS